jgi:type IV pilus assembly protein PilB
MADPLNVLAIDDVKRITKLEVYPLIASERAIIDKLNSIDAAKSGSMEDIINDAQRQADDDSDADKLEVSKETMEEVNLDQLAASSEEAPVIKLANLILVQAIKDRASDIHIEPFEKMVRLRYRVDGALIDVTPPPKQMQLALASRLKIMSSLDIAERRLPQDGRMRVKVGGKDYDLRVSFLPTVHGEKCVLRVLDKSNLSASMDKLGLDPDTFSQFKQAVDAPHGLILVTGPTGSGKTTTLYSALNELNNPAVQHRHRRRPRRIPGPRHQPGPRQKGNRPDLRQRPALHPPPGPGHHHDRRNPRHRNRRNRGRSRPHRPPGLEHHALQRRPRRHRAPRRHGHRALPDFLLRHSCLRPAPHAAHLFPLQGAGGVSAQDVSDLNIDPSIFEGVTLYRGRGCERCKNSGYAGRLAIIEAMTITDEIRKLVIARANTREMGKIAVGQGMRTLRMAALDRVRDGISTLEQVLVLMRIHPPHGKASAPAVDSLTTLSQGNFSSFATKAVISHDGSNKS